jgi:BirA family biotin operon repressor/biotin-[acetyl-CoA-carboxylase] ligase
MEQIGSFYILDSVDSTNNYAMAKVHEGMANHGDGWYARSQTSGKGQRGKNWEATRDQNIVLSIAIKPALCFRANPFYLSAYIALRCSQFLENSCQSLVQIKWPNDLYINDRKAGGILIENLFAGNQWKWAIVGIGINVNQNAFSQQVPSAISLKDVSSQHLDPIKLSKQLHQEILHHYEAVHETNTHALIADYNKRLFKKNQTVQLRHNRAVFSTSIKGVSETGELLTQDVMERRLAFGSVEWVQ